MPIFFINVSNKDKFHLWNTKEFIEGILQHCKEEFDYQGANITKLKCYFNSDLNEGILYYDSTYDLNLEIRNLYWYYLNNQYDITFKSSL